VTESTAAALRLFAVILAIAAVWFFGDRITKAIQAPVQAELRAARGNNAAMKAGLDAQNAGVDAAKKASEERKAKSAAAVKGAGKQEFARAKALEEARPAGDTPLARAANFLNETYGARK
jgi:hypothetical protein